MQLQKIEIFKLTIFFIVLVAAVLLYFFTDLNRLTSEDLRIWLGHYGKTAAVIFVLIYCVLPLFLFPSWILSVSSGVLFGPVSGALLTLTGASLGATIVFLFARYFARALQERFVESRKFNIRDMNRNIEKNGFRYMLFIRLIPLFPYNILNYAFAFTKIKTRDYILGTIIGMLPVSFAYAYLGSNLFLPGSRGLYAAIILILILVIVPILFRKRIQG